MSGHENGIPSKQKMEIRIIGGPYDRITTVLEEFEPGQEEFIVPLASMGIAPRVVKDISHQEVHVTVPARLHATVLDMNRFNLNRPGGGGIGIGIEVYFQARVRSIPEPAVRVSGERTLIMKHFGHLFKRLLGYPGGFDIEVYDHKRRHVGLGSTCGAMTAVSIGLNEVLGRPFGGWELRRIIGYHSCEESPSGNGYLMPAFETGIGAMVGVNGGWVLASDDLTLVYRVPLPDTRALVFIPDVPSLADEYTGVETAAESEVELLMRRARQLDAAQVGAKSRIILLDMLPAMIRGDLKAMGDALFEICYLGSKRAECEQHGSGGTPIYDYITKFRDMGIEVTGMSSVGPTVFALTRNQGAYERALKYLRSQGVPESRIVETAVDNRGGRITHHGVERSFIGEGWLLG